MLKIAVCDDENFYLNKIEDQIRKNLINRNLIDYEISTFSSAKELYESGERIREFQVFFLDINMSEINGLDLARRVREENKNALLVFITAYIDYALEGYQVEAVRFIIKDMLEQMLPECLDAVLHKLKLKNWKLEFHFQEGKKKLSADQIVYVESSRHKVHFYIEQQNQKLMNYSLYSKLDNIQQELEEYGFLRIHKSYLVNMKYITDIVKYKVILTMGLDLPIPRGKYSVIEGKYYENEGKLI